jgi:hypothetical protein
VHGYASANERLATDKAIKGDLISIHNEKRATDKRKWKFAKNEFTIQKRCNHGKEASQEVLSSVHDREATLFTLEFPVPLLGIHN